MQYLVPDSPSADTPDRETTALERFLTQQTTANSEQLRGWYLSEAPRD